MDAGKVNIWVCTAWHPSKQQSVSGTFVQEQIEIVHDYLGDRVKLTVLNPLMPLDLKALLWQGRKPFYDEWYYQGRDVKIYQYQGKLFWHRFPFDIHLSNRFYLKRILRKILPERGKPDRFWAVTLSGAFVAHAINELMSWNVPVLLQEHSIPLEMHLRWPWQIRQWSAIQNTIQVIVVAERQVAEFRAQGYMKEIVVVPNPVNPVFLQVKKGIRQNLTHNLRIISTGHLEAQKMPLRQLEAAARLKEAGVSFVWRWIGAGNLMQVCQERIKHYGLQDYFIMEGTKQRYEIAASLAEADLFVLSSAYENCPVALIEAQCVGLPCIVHRNGASEKILLPGNGMAIDMDDEGKSLKAAVLEMAGKVWGHEGIKSRSQAVFHPEAFAKQISAYLCS